MNSRQYQSILSDQMKPSARLIFAEEHDDEEHESWIFQQDNDPKHKSRLVQDWLAQEGIQQLEWPPQSPDLNPIENLWSILDYRCKKRKCSNETELIECLESSWNEVTEDTLLNLVNSMPNRCQTVIDNKGFMTKY